MSSVEEKSVLGHRSEKASRVFAKQVDAKIHPKNFFFIPFGPKDMPFFSIQITFFQKSPKTLGSAYLVTVLV